MLTTDAGSATVVLPIAFFTSYLVLTHYIPAVSQARVDFIAMFCAH
jgi:hypothetical protein